MAWPTLHEQKNHRFGAAGVLRVAHIRQCLGGTGGTSRAFAQQTRESQAAEATTGFRQKVAAGSDWWDVRSNPVARRRVHVRLVQIKKLVQIQERVTNVFQRRLFVGRRTRLPEE